MADIVARASHVLAGGPGTFSKAPARYPQGLAPTALVSGKGAYVTGDDGRTYLDTVSALGANLLGYGHPAVNDAIVEQLCRGTSFSMLHPLEVEVAETLVELLPCADMVRWCRNGTDATNMAVRLARAFTGHQHVVFVGYAGGAMDSYGSTTDRAAGILPQIAPYNHQIPWGDLVAVPQRALEDLAALVVEVPPRPWEEAPEVTSGKLHWYAEMARLYGALFVVDEVVTFPRYGLYGAQGIYGIIPDLCCVSKGLANGLPLAALVGQRQFMERLNAGDIFASSTFAGETTALAACQATLTVCATTAALDTLWAQGQAVGDGLGTLFDRYEMPATVWGNPARLQIRWLDCPGVATKDELRTYWMAEHVKRGVLYGIGVIFPQACWGVAEVETLLHAAEEVCGMLRTALQAEGVPLRDRLECPVIPDVIAARAV